MIDINTGTEHFIFQFTSFDENQTDYTIKMGGVTGKFGIIYQSKGIDCNFECDITIGNVYAFYLSLDTAYDIMFGRNSVAALENYGTLNRTALKFRFDKRGHCFVDGHFKNKDDLYKSGISFSSFEIYQSDITGILKSMDIFFQEIRRIQGHNTFY